MYNPFSTAVESLNAPLSQEVDKKQIDFKEIIYYPCYLSYLLFHTFSVLLANVGELTFVDILYTWVIGLFGPP